MKKAPAEPHEREVELEVELTLQLTSLIATAVLMRQAAAVAAVEAVEVKPAGSLGVHLT